MIIMTLPRVIAALFILLGGVNAAEVTPSTTWTLTLDLPEKKQDVDLTKYTAILVMESHLPDCLLKEIMVEVLPTSGLTANAFGLYTTEDVTSEGGARMPKRIAVNFTPTKFGIIEVMKNFITNKYGKEDIFGSGPYKFTNRYVHENTRTYCCISFTLTNYENVGIILGHLATIADLSDVDRVVFNQAYAVIESCAKK